MSKTNKQKSIWEDIVEAGREVLRELEELLTPRKRPKPVPVPVPVRPNNPPRRPSNYS